MNQIPTIAFVCEQANQLPCAPWVLPRLIATLEDSNATTKDVEQLIAMDPGLASTTLRMANSVFVSMAGQRCDSLDQAVLRLGFKGLYRMAATAAATRWLNQDIKGYGWQKGDLARHSLCVAIAAETLADEMGGHLPFKKEVAYAAGLLHDIGKLALAHAYPDLFEQIRQMQKTVYWRQAEHEILGYDHTDIGGALLKNWDFPEKFIQVARFYSRPQMSEAANRALVTHIHAAKHLAILIGLGVGEEGFQTELDEEALKQAGYSSETMEHLLPSILHEAKKVLSDIH